MTACVTVDLEQDCPPFMETWRGMAEGAPRLLDLLERLDIKATFFTTGQSAERFPETIERLLAQGHELACHGMTHRAFPDLDSSEAEWEIATSSEILRQFTDVISFRAPYLRFPDAYLPIVAAHGYAIDASQAKYKRSYRRPQPETPLVRIAASVTSSVLRLPAIVRNPWLRSLASPAVVFVHPWEFVDLTETDLRLDCRFKTGQPALDALEASIAVLAARGLRFETIRDVAGARNAAGLAAETGQAVASH